MSPLLTMVILLFVRGLNTSSVIAFKHHWVKDEAAAQEKLGSTAMCVISSDGWIEEAS